MPSQGKLLETAARNLVSAMEAIEIANGHYAMAKAQYDALKSIVVRRPDPSEIGGLSDRLVAMDTVEQAIQELTALYEP